MTSATGRVGEILTIVEGAAGYLITVGNVDLGTGRLRRKPNKRTGITEVESAYRICE